MNPYLKEVRKLIKDIKSINPDVFPIAIIGGLYARPESSFFKSNKTPRMWNFIQKTDIGYLTSHETMPEDCFGFCGCPLSCFDDTVKIEVRDILKNVLAQIQGKEE